MIAEFKMLDNVDGCKAALIDGNGNQVLIGGLVKEVNLEGPDGKVITIKASDLKNASYKL